MAFEVCDKDLFQTIDGKNAHVQLYGGAVFNNGEGLSIRLDIDGKTYELDTKLIQFKEWKE